MAIDYTTNLSKLNHSKRLCYNCYMIVEISYTADDNSINTYNCDNCGEEILTINE